MTEYQIYGIVGTVGTLLLFGLYVAHLVRHPDPPPRRPAPPRETDIAVYPVVLEGIMTSSIGREVMSGFYANGWDEQWLETADYRVYHIMQINNLLPTTWEIREAIIAGLNA